MSEPEIVTALAEVPAEVTETVAAVEAPVAEAVVEAPAAEEVAAEATEAKPAE